MDPTPMRPRNGQRRPWPGAIADRVEWMRHELGELESIHSAVLDRAKQVSERADGLYASMKQTRSEIGDMETGLNAISGEVDQVAIQLADFRSRLGIEGAEEDEGGESDPSAETTDTPPAAADESDGKVDEPTTEGAPAPGSQQT